MRLVYFASPMCSWCWGFSPVIQQLNKSNSVDHIRLVLTPFRIDMTEPMDDGLRSYVLKQWLKVHQTTAQPFDFRFAMPLDFIYNTRLACLAIKAFSKQLPEVQLDYIHALQHVYYTENKDITDQDELVNVAATFSLSIELFTQDLNNKEIVNILEKDFFLCQQLAVQSYPTLMTEKNGNYSMLANGYMPYAEVISKIESCKAS